MRLFSLLSVIILVLFLSVSSSAQDSADKDILYIPLKDPEVSLSVGLSPHYSSFHFFGLHRYGYDIRRNYKSMKFSPLTHFKIEAGANNITLNYSLVTTFPLQPTYNIYERSGKILNTATYEEWSQTVGGKINIFRALTIGLNFHHRTTRFRDYDSDPTVQFEYNLQNQKNLLLTAENLLSLNNFTLKPSISYSLRQWDGPGFNSFYRNTPLDDHTTDYTVPINGLTDYFSFGMTVGNKTLAKNFSLNISYDSFSNAMIENNRYLFSIAYKFDVLERIMK